MIAIFIFVVHNYALINFCLEVGMIKIHMHKCTNISIIISIFACTNINSFSSYQQLF